MTGVITPAGWLRSVPAAARDLWSGRTRCTDGRLGEVLVMRDGRTYVPFRHTRKTGPASSAAVPGAVLEARFRLPGFGPDRRWLHAVFRAVCIVTTPFFVGLPGFRSKLWMEDPVTGDFAGLYEWDDPDTAAAYGTGLGKVLRRLAVAGSVSAELDAGMTVDEYLAAARRRSVAA